MARVQFRFITGIRRTIFTRVILSGSWDEQGRFCERWSEQVMEAYTHTDGCPAYRFTCELDDNDSEREFSWGIYIDSAQYRHTWGIIGEIKSSTSTRRIKSFRLQAGSQVQDLYLTHNRRLGANKHYTGGNKPGIRFAVWAPHAERVEVIITPQGAGEQVFACRKEEDGIWAADPATDPGLGDFAAWPGARYHYRITREDGTTAERSDLYAHVLESGTMPREAVITDPDAWWEESRSTRAPLATRNLIIYTLQPEALGYGHDEPGNLGDALLLLPHWKELGITAIELLPPLAEESSVCYFRQNPDAFREFAAGCHKWGIRLLVTFNCSYFPVYPGSPFWKYDAVQDEDNIYFWYEGKASDYPFDADKKGHHGGYIDNSTVGYAPRYHEDMVRRYFISCAVFLMEEFGVDGFRIQRVSSIHNNNKLNCNKSHIVNSVNIYGAKFLREFTRSLKLIDRNVLLIAEDHSQWDRITRPIAFDNQEDDGVGFDCVWFAGYYYNMTGDTTANQYSYARLLYEAGFGENWPLKMDLFAYQGLLQVKPHHVIYHESPHGASDEDEIASSRIVEVASHFRLSGEYLQNAVARCKFAAGITLLSTGIPQLFMFEEVPARHKFKQGSPLSAREDYLALKTNEGKNLCNFYQHLIHLRKEHPALSSANIKVLHIHNTNRIIAFTRWDETESLIVIASLNNNPFIQGYEISHYEIDGEYREIFNSDYSQFGGENVGNYGLDIPGSNNSLSPMLPANGIIVLAKKQTADTG